MLLDHRGLSLSFRDLLSTNRMGWGEESLPERPQVDRPVLTLNHISYHPLLLIPVAGSSNLLLIHPVVHCYVILPGWWFPGVLYTACVPLYVCVHSFFIKKEENAVWDKWGREAAKISVLSVGDRKSNVPFPEVSTRRERVALERTSQTLS